MSRPISIACLQTRPMPDFESATEEALTLASEAVRGGAAVLALPEYCGGLATEGLSVKPPAAAESIHPVLNALRRFCAERNVWTLIGSVAVPGAAGRVINRGFLVDAGGEIRAQYDKIHMFDIQLSDTEIYRESDTVAAGDRAALYEAPWGKLGHTICHDLRFPNLYRDLAQAGAEILAVPAAFTKKTGEVHWHVLNRARAIENAAYLIAPCAIGPVPGGGECYGHSLIVDPWGSVIADGGDDRGWIMATIDLDRVAEARRKIPSLRHDRPYRSAIGRAPNADSSNASSASEARGR